MSTNSTIAVENADKTISVIYCHWNGHIDSVGKTLQENYTTIDKVQALVALGSISSLGSVIGVKHDFDSRDIDVCTAYNRDRGEELVVERFDNLEHYFNNSYRQQFNYIFLSDVWYVGTNSTLRSVDTEDRLVRVDDALEDL